MYIFESYLNLHSNLKTFLSIVFEGQIIAAVVVILGLVLLLLREFFLANVEEAPPPPPRPNFNVPVGRRRRLFQRGVRGDVVRNAEPVPQPEPQMIAVQPQPLEIEPEQRIRQFGERYKVLAQDNPNPTIIRGSSPSNRLPPSPMMPRDRFREEGETRRASVVSWDLQELQDQSNRSFSNQEQEHGESQQSGSSRSYQSGSSSSQQFIPSSSQPLEDRAQQGRYNLRPRPERVDNGWSDSEFSSSIILERTGRDSDISSRDEIREREVEMERERVRAERERLERERLERERQLRQEMLRQEAEAEAERERAIQEMIRDVAVEQDEPEQNLNANDEDINMVLNVGINDGEIVAQFELNNVNAFLDLVGVTGPIIKLVHSVAIVHLIVFVVLGMGVWIPYLAGHTAVWLFFSGLVPTVEHIIDYSIKALQALSDPIVEPIADLLLNLFNSSTAAIVEKNSTNFMDTVLRTIGANLTTEKVTYGPYHPNFFHAFQEDLSMVFLGYVFLFVLLLAYAVN